MEPQHLYISKESTPPGANECADAESIFQVAKTGISAGVSAAEEAVLVDEAQEESVTTREVENIIRFHPNSFLAETFSTSVLQWLEFIHDSEGRVDRDSYGCKIL